MVTLNETQDSITFTLSSLSENIDQVLFECDAFLKQHEICSTNACGKVLKELVSNAVEHGNNNEKNKIVTGTITLEDKNCIRIIIKDEGIGFDYHQVIAQTDQIPGSDNSRGYLLIRSYTDQITFEENGSRVVVTLPITQRSTSFSITRQNSETITICPNTDLTSAVREELRNLLVGYLHQNPMIKKYIIDLINVRNIDSVSLSILIIFCKEAKKLDDAVKIMIVNVNEEMAALFTATRLQTVFEIRYR